MLLDRADERPLRRHGYAVGVVCVFVRLVMNGISMRGAARVGAVMAEAFGLSVDIPDWTTGRLWLMRLGHAMLTMALEQADDWAWLADHSVQIGKEKVLVILGIRLRDLPADGECLQHHHLRLIALEVRTSWTRAEVDESLEKAVARTGVPRVIVSDHGVDLHGGVELFQGRHSETEEIYDIKHKAACLLKHRLEKDPRWPEFQRGVGQTRCSVQQTEAGFLVPPSPRSKARFMNLGPQLEWAERVLKVLRDPPAEVLKWVSRDRLQEKFGWLREFADAISEWSQWQQAVNLAVEYVGRHGISRFTAAAMYQEMPRPIADAGTAALVEELENFVAAQGLQTAPGERFPGSTEVLESCFGKMKVLEKQQSRGGFTGLLLSFGAMLAETTSSAIKAALEHSGTQDVWDWCKEHLGTTLFAKRKLAFANRATESG
jgi:hypothetical protein